ncbi:hypothetical protein VKS41_004582 [Umbelopsis sp. WA50703]
MGTPEQLWSQSDQNLVIPTDYSLCVGFSLQTGTLLLLQCFWNYLSASVAKASFMSSFEFRFYLVWCVLSVVMFPLLQWEFSQSKYDENWKEIIPELAYGCELFIVSILGVYASFRFNRLIKQTRNSINAKEILARLTYFVDLNATLTASLMIDSICFIVLSADGLTTQRYLNLHKFSADLLICIANFASVIVWFLVIMIFHPDEEITNLASSHSAGRELSDFPSRTGNAVSNHTDYISYQPMVLPDKSYNISPMQEPKFDRAATQTPNWQRPNSPMFADTRPLAVEEGIKFFPVTHVGGATGREEYSMQEVDERSDRDWLAQSPKNNGLKYGSYN